MIHNNIHEVIVRSGRKNSGSRMSASFAKIISDGQGPG